MSQLFRFVLNRPSAFLRSFQLPSSWKSSFIVSHPTMKRQSFAVRKMATDRSHKFSSQDVVEDQDQQREQDELPDWVRPTKQAKREEHDLENLEDKEENKEGIWHENEEGELYFNLKANGTRRVTIRKFKDIVGVDIREYYEDKNTGKMKPGRKGIYLTREQYDTLKEHLEDIDCELHSLDTSV